ncbi:MAG TPA: hypothetical protein VFH78_15690 [Candidatus Thermoplasmatota archaeon]|nr:hypothetical protein [Candidatus Thermoplasmatota archaeon]
MSPREEPVFNAERGTWDVVEARDDDGNATSIVHFANQDDALAYWHGEGGCCP